MFYKIIATVFFIGYFPVAPGTVATVFGLLFLLLLKPPYITLLAIFSISLILGVFASEKIEMKRGEKDPSCIVIDEFTGYMAAMLFIPINLNALLLAFIVFRILDIFKPPPIKQIERKLRGGLSVMMDDVVAGLITNLLMRIFSGL